MCQFASTSAAQWREEKPPGSSCKEPLPQGQVPPPHPRPDPVLFPAQGILNFLPRLSPLSAANKRQDWQPLHKHDKQEAGGVRRLSPWGPSSHAPRRGFLTNPQTSSSRVGLALRPPPPALPLPPAHTTTQPPLLLARSCRFSQNMHEVGVTK